MWGDKAQERERGFTPVMSVTKLSSLCKCLASTKFGSTVTMCLPARVVARSSTASTDTLLFVFMKKIFIFEIPV